VGALLLNKDVKVKRSPSLRSESNQSSLSDSRHVSFNQDVSIKRIPKKVAKTKSLDPNDEFHQKCNQFVNIPPPSDQSQIADEAEQILRQLDDIECSVSPTPRITSPVRNLVSPTPRPESRQSSRQGTPLGSAANTLERKGSHLLGRLSKSSSDLVRSVGRRRAMRVEGTSEQEDSPGPGGDSRLYGLQALSNLDNAVNGKVNNLYRDNSGSIDYSPPAKKNNLTPPKPPRKAPSASPPSIRKGYASHDELDYRSKSRSEMYERGDPETGGAFSFAGANPSLNHLRQSPSRQSPSRGNHTDSEILSSPTQVLYATISADKHKHTGNLKNQHIQTQTVQTGFRPISAERQMKAWASSKENILDDPPSYRYRNGSNGSSKHASRSLERFVDDDKENIRRNQELKARIHVSSPMQDPRRPPERQASASRKPYKTTINTATDTIQYKGFSSENLVDKNDPRRQKNLARHSGKKVDTEHYKVPKNKAPVPAEFITRKGRTSSENSSAFNGNYHAPEKNSNLKTQFASTSLVRNAVSENRQKRGEYDREGRRIHSSGRSGERNRAYSGYSTSPDREMSPDRYAKPRGTRMASPRSPSSSPQRPPRARGSPSREMIVPIRREHSGREVERSPSTRASATSRSPIKKIQRVHNEIKGDGSQGAREASPHQTRTLTLTKNRSDNSRARGAKNMLVKKQENHQEDDRLSKFTEYRGGSGDQPVAPARSQSGGRRGSAGYELRREHSGGGMDGRSEGERERGQSVPPGANIDSMRDFYKTNQYRSMYHLPPSPSRPAPVLDRGGKSLERPGLRREQTGELQPPPRRQPKNSVSEGELTDDQARAERVQRQRNKFLNNMMNKGDQQSQGQATLNRRVASGDRESAEAGKRVIRTNNGEKLNNQRNGSHERPVRRPAPQPPMPPTQRVRRSSVEVLETNSESESPRPEAKLAADAGRWAGGQSDIEADYRQQLATNSVHMEARGRSGEVSQVPSIYQQAATLNRKKSGSKTQVDGLVRGRSHERSVREVEISQDDEEDEVVRQQPTSLSRDEERRKIIELEEERRRKEMKPGNVSRSGSRVSKIMGGKLKGPRLAGGGGETETDAQSQYSGHSAPNLMKSRYNSNGRVKRTGSSATTSSARQIISRKKMPGSLTSSVNSSESENGQSAISRATGASAASNRSVFLHATAVADIPSNKPNTAGDRPGPVPASNLQKSKKISRSISLLAPFKKTAPAKEKEVMYDSSGQVVAGGSGKPPRAPPAPVRRLPAGEPMSRDKKFASSSDLLQDEQEVNVQPQQEPIASGKTSSRVSRSVSMPKDTRLAGWFKKRKRV